MKHEKKDRHLYANLDIVLYTVGCMSRTKLNNFDCSVIKPKQYTKAFEVYKIKI